MAAAGTCSRPQDEWSCHSRAAAQEPEISGNIKLLAETCTAAIAANQDTRLEDRSQHRLANVHRPIQQRINLLLLLQMLSANSTSLAVSTTLNLDYLFHYAVPTLSSPAFVSIPYRLTFCVGLYLIPVPHFVPAAPLLHLPTSHFTPVSSHRNIRLMLPSVIGQCLLISPIISTPTEKNSDTVLVGKRVKGTHNTGGRELRRRTKLRSASWCFH